MLLIPFLITGWQIYKITIAGIWETAQVALDIDLISGRRIIQFTLLEFRILIL
jgi:hypothetical protein